MIELYDYIYVDSTDSLLAIDIAKQLTNAEFNVKVSWAFDMSLMDFHNMVFNDAKDIRKYVVVSDRVKYANAIFMSNNIVDCKDRAFDKIIADVKWILENFGRSEHMTSNTYFWSDPHFCHKNIIKYCKRPWCSDIDADGNYNPTDADVNDMNETLIKNFNDIVKPNDIVWCLGDFAFAGKNNVIKMLSRLNGNIRLIRGNHDKMPNKFYLDAGFKWVYDHPVIINDYIVLSHEPLAWIKSGLPYVNLFGHVHNQEMYKHFTENSYNCSVEVNDYKPVSWKTIVEHFKNSRKDA